MKILEVVQGTQEWHDARANHFTASEAPAMAGVSKYQTRAELLKQKYTGVAEEVTAAQQKLFDRGHATEAAARPIAEEIIGQELYPVTGVSEEHPHLLASLDGSTMLEDIIFEHKLWNESLVAAVQANDLPEHYKVQMDQQLLVSGAERCLFMCSDGTRENAVWCWHEADQARFDALLAGWEQFRADLEAYQPTEQKVTPQGEAPEALPALKIDLTGAVKDSNLPDFKARALAMINGIRTELTTDQHFADAAETVKFLQKGEKQLEASKKTALEQTASISELFNTIDELRETMRKKRLHLDKLVKAEKENRRLEIQRKAVDSFMDWLTELGGHVTPHHTLDVAGAMKGKKTIASLQAAADDEVARAKVESQQDAKRLTDNLALLEQEQGEHGFLFVDWRELIQKQADDLVATIKARIAEHKEAVAKREEAERERIRQEEAAKAKAEAEQQAQQEKPQESAHVGVDTGAGDDKTVRQPIDTSKITAAADRGAALKPAREVEQPDTVTISRKEYDALLEARAKLDALEAAGVDNWSGYPDAMAQLEAA
ncbi:YqaJ viral recombinase family protein [Halomonas sp. I1]|uniref:lambda-exonuclease family protein n=1 Tax=Halomonas sp. I1 TaxID=393536 RepID=UPI0028DDAD04|nr:YqaJ viral recombinase family protein [Halomonas sp. I1]MDT8894230.1 YqaJ viral recombinase family protein [Halomonas sp. I1]